MQTTGRRPAPRGEHGAAAAAGKLFVFGGQKLSRPKGRSLALALLLPQPLALPLALALPVPVAFTLTQRSP